MSEAEPCWICFEPPTNQAQPLTIALDHVVSSYTVKGKLCNKSNYIYQGKRERRTRTQRERNPNACTNPTQPNKTIFIMSKQNESSIITEQDEELL